VNNQCLCLETGNSSFLLLTVFQSTPGKLVSDLRCHCYLNGNINNVVIVVIVVDVVTVVVFVVVF